MVLLELTGDQGIGTGCQNLIDRTLPGACKDGNFFGLSHSVFHGVIPIGKQIVEPLTQFVPVVGTGGKQPDIDSLERQKSSDRAPDPVCLPEWRCCQFLHDSPGAGESHRLPSYDPYKVLSFHNLNRSWGWGVSKTDRDDRSADRSSFQWPDGREPGRHPHSPQSWISRRCFPAVIHFETHAKSGIPARHTRWSQKLITSCKSTMDSRLEGE